MVWHYHALETCVALFKLAKTAKETPEVLVLPFLGIFELRYLKLYYFYVTTCLFSSFVMTPGALASSPNTSCLVSSMDSSSWHYYGGGGPSSPSSPPTSPRVQSPPAAAAKVEQPQSYEPKFNSSLTEVSDERSLR